jgi:hypothetical protein
MVQLSCSLRRPALFTLQKKVGPSTLPRNPLTCMNPTARAALPPFHSITSSAMASRVGGTSRPSALAVLIADWSGLVDLVDGNDGKRAGPTRIVHAGHGIDGLTDLCDGKTVAWRDHAGRT